MLFYTPVVCIRGVHDVFLSHGCRSKIQRRHNVTIFLLFSSLRLLNVSSGYRGYIYIVLGQPYTDQFVQRCEVLSFVVTQLYLLHEEDMN